MVIDAHPVASAPIKALMYFCLSPPLAEKGKSPARRAVVDFKTSGSAQEPRLNAAGFHILIL
jgi:hypothetical protein